MLVVEYTGCSTLHIFTANLACPLKQPNDGVTYSHKVILTPAHVSLRTHSPSFIISKTCPSRVSPHSNILNGYENVILNHPNPPSATKFRPSPILTPWQRHASKKQATVWLYFSGPMLSETLRTRAQTKRPAFLLAYVSRFYQKGWAN